MLICRQYVHFDESENHCSFSLASLLGLYFLRKRRKRSGKYVGKIEYRLLSLNSHERVDLDFDGIKNSDLLNEVQTFYNKPLYANFDAKTLNALWMETSYDNQKIGFLPLYHPPGTPVNYVPVQNVYRFKILAMDCCGQRMILRITTIPLLCQKK